MPRRDTARTMLGASGLTVLGSISPFLLGAQAVLMQRDLGFGPARLGVAVSVFFGVAALSTILGVGVFTRLGRRVGLVVAGGLVAVGGLLVATVVQGWWALVLAMAVLGMGNAACQTTANAAVATALPVHRRGLGFGIKQSAVPVAIMFGGLAVPTTTVLLGWRSTFIIIAVVGLAVALVGATRPARRVGTTVRPVGALQPDRAPRGPLLLCGAAVAFASAPANFLGSYLASWAHEVGLTVEEAGVLLAVGSASSVLMRIATGHRADRRHGANLPVVAGMILGGAVCLALLGAVPQTWAVIVFGLLAFAVGWSWPGLILYAVARLGRDAPTQASSVIQAGAFLGGATGPASLGLVVSLLGFSVAWYVASASFVVSALLIMAARRGFRADLETRPPAQPFGYGGGRGEPRYTTRPPDAPM
ncbi:MFS transporter [Ornithinimicrobium sufpigmenti]|uniref:MFS transporter n=1 Tax=Ornithinimicrobium sufpigmenti TaxID=2508882 RepID=UPI0010363330|nr:MULTISPECIES: MFS transporter [unclassified Ornithinimicrobium]